MPRRYIDYSLVVVTGVALGCGEVRDANPDGGAPPDAHPDTDAGGASDAATRPQASAAHSTISGEEGVVADGDATAEIEIELLDDAGEPVPGIVPEFSASGEGNTYETCSESDASGTSTCEMSTTEGGEKLLEITEPVSVSGDAITFLFECVDEAGVEFGGGEGDADDPYRLCVPEHLQGIAHGTAYLDSSFVVARDIDMQEIANFVPIGNTSDRFVGELDGQGFTISNLTIDRPSTDDVGLFGATGEDAVIENVVLVDIDVSGNQQVGGLAGSSRGLISDSAVTGVIEGAESEIRTGGLAGLVTGGGEVERCFADGTVSGGEFVGGLVGHQGSSIVRDSYSTAEVSGEDRVGGLTGTMSGSGEQEIYNSYAAGPVAGDEERVGALVGRSLAGTTVEASYWDEDTATVTESAEGDPLDTESFDSEEPFDWDFDDVWTIGEAPDGVTRPILQWQE